MCARFTAQGDLSKKLVQKHLSFEQIKSIFPEELIPQLVYVYGCGVHGEPFLNPETLQIYEHFRRHRHDIILGGHTNGGIQNPDFWKDLAKIASKINFSIDGLEDTNHLYRRQVNWDRVIENANSFISSGGYAIWNFLVFKHNEHQIQEAQSLAKKLGFKQFIVKSTSRFLNFSELSYSDHWPVHNKSGEKIYDLQPSSLVPNQAIQTIKEQLPTKEHLYRFLEKTAIQCRAQTDKSIYVDSLGFIFPCCFLGGETVKEAPRASFLNQIENLGLNLDAFDSKIHSLRDIVQSSIFQKSVPQSWKQKSFADGRLYTCSRVCGKSLDVFNSQFSKTIELQSSP